MDKYDLQAQEIIKDRATKKEYGRVKLNGKYYIRWYGRELKNGKGLTFNQAYRRDKDPIAIIQDMYLASILRSMHSCMLHKALMGEKHEQNVKFYKGVQGSTVKIKTDKSPA